MKNRSRIRRAWRPLALALVALAAGPAWAGYEESAVLEALDKVTGRVFKLQVALESVVEFGALRIVARSCYKAPPEETPESTAFLEISEVKPGEQPVLLFKGWMFASSPGLSTLEHPTYDVIVLDCAPAPLTAKQKASYFVDPMPAETPSDSPPDPPGDASSE